MTQHRLSGTSLLRDLRMLSRLALHPGSGETHAERLESFYRGQARDYDAFRRRLLPGRQSMIEQLPMTPGAVWVDMGAGTGANLEFLACDVEALRHVYLVDLAPSLLALARERILARGLSNVTTHAVDATDTGLRPGTADIVTFSYSLTMIPDWFEALRHACELLRPGGHIGVVDFYVARKFPAPGYQRHGWFTRHFWPTWFARDNVFLSRDHLPFLAKRFGTVCLEENTARLPYLPLSRVPYYVFIGRKPHNGPISNGPFTGV